MSLNTNRARLIGVTKELLLKWEETQTHWRDVRGQEFGKAYMDTLGQHINKAAAVCEQLEKITTKVRADCE